MTKTTVRLTFLIALLALGGCVCRAGHVGPYGGYRAGGCWVEATNTSFG